MIRLFKSTETDFTHNGVHVLDDIVLGDTCILSNGINEVYSLEMEVSIYNNSKWKDIEPETILKVPTLKGEQLFRIKEVVKNFSTLKIYGKHVFFDLENNFILDTNVVQKDGRSAIAQILGGMSNNSINTFHGTSDISVVNNSRLVRKNVVTALIGDDDNSFLNRWGGELQLDNFNFSINERIGSDRGFQIRYGKNATGYEGNINTYNLCTRIVPVGFDGLMLEGTKWVDSPNIDKYPQIYTYEVKFEDIKVKENEDDEEGYNTIEEAREGLREAAVNYFTSTKCDLPSFSAVVNFITLRNTEEYKNVKTLETVALGDDVSIYLSNIDVNASSRVVREKWNFFTKKHTELEIGEIKPNVFKQLINIKDTIDNIVENLGGNTWQDIINKSLDEATKLMEEGLKGSHVIAMKNQIVIGDAPDIKDMVNCIVMNKNGIGFSNNGYLPDRLVSAMTIDGKINASCITVGELNAALIKAGILMSKSGKIALSIEDDYFEVTHTEADTKMMFDAKGMYLIDLTTHDTIAQFASKDYGSVVTASNVYANNIVNKYSGKANLYVSHVYTGESNGDIDSPFKSFNELLDHFGSARYIDRTINIYVDTDLSAQTYYNDCFQLNGFWGSGNFNIYFSKYLVLRWTNNHTVDFRDNQLLINIYAGNTGTTANDGAIIDNRTASQGTYTHCCYFLNCSKVIIKDGIRVRAAQWSDDNNSGICADNSYVYVEYVDTCDSGQGFYVANGGKIVVINSRGNCTIKPAYILNGGALYQGMPGQTKLVQMGTSVVQNGHNYTFGTLTGSDSLLITPPTPPAATEEVKYIEFNLQDYGYYNVGYASWNPNGKNIYQGNYGYGNCKGIITLNNTAINSYLSGKTILDGSTISLSRANNAGNSGATTVYLCGTTHTSASGSEPPVTKSYGSIGSLAWGESKTFSLPKAFAEDLKSGTIKSILFYVSSGGNYIKFNPSCKLRIKVKG